MARRLRKCKKAAPEAFLKSRMTRLVRSSADTVFYATTEGFKLSTHNSKVFEIYPDSLATQNGSDQRRSCDIRRPVPHRVA